MHFGFTTDQLALRDLLRGLLEDICPPHVVRAAWNAGQNPLPQLWKQLGELGLFGLLVPQEQGGIGCSEIELVMLLEECGRFALPGPIGEHLAVAVPALCSAGAPEFFAALCGDVVVTVQESPLSSVRWARRSGLMVRLTPENVYLSPMASLSLGEERPSVDRSASPCAVDGGTLTPLAVDPELSRRRATLAAAAQLVGLAGRQIELAAEYAKSRTQFGAPIGSYQAVKHLLATALVAVEHARPVAYWAGWVLASGAEEADLAVSFAKVYATRAADLAARTALQCHGAIGYTWEHDLHLWMKRVWALASMWGTLAEHEEIVAKAVLDEVC